MLADVWKGAYETELTVPSDKRCSFRHMWNDLTEGSPLRHYSDRLFVLKQNFYRTKNIRFAALQYYFCKMRDGMRPLQWIIFVCCETFKKCG